MLLLDCSVLMAWVAPDESSDYALSVRQIMIKHNLPLIAPPLFFIEIVNVLDVMERRRRMTREQAENAVNLLQRLPITIDTEGAAIPAIVRIRQLMQRHALTAYDASYLELAKRRSLPLATLDNPLRIAAEAEALFFTLP